VHRHLAAAGLVAPQPRKRPRSSWTRFQAEQPNELWQSDFTHWPLTGGRDAEILAWIDDHSRYALSLTAHTPVTGADVVAAFRAACQAHGDPAATLTDNGLVFTTRLATGGRNALEAELAARGITQKNGKPSHPQTQGKVERFHQTLKRWLARQPPAETLPALQNQLGRFAGEYNNRRPHRSLDRGTPAAACTARAKAAPIPASGHPDTRTARVASNGAVTHIHDGRRHHIALGRRHAGTAVLVTSAGTAIKITDPATGELLRDLTLDPDRDYQPTGKPPGRTRENPAPEM
jgi:transposase InsO family protein